MKMESKITLKFTPADLNMILGSLGQLPYNQVHTLIEQIHIEAGRQLASINEEQTPAKFEKVNTN